MSQFGQSIKVRLLSKSLYILLGAVYLLNSHSEGLNVDRRNQERAQVSKARALLASLPAGTESICNDGWRSPSTGPGTCSWHGGKNYEPQQRIDDLRSFASQDPEKKFKGAESNRRVLLWIGLIMAWWLSLGFEQTFFPRRRGP